MAWRHLRSDELKAFLAEARAAWMRGAKIGPMSLVFNGKQIAPEYVADLWINGHYFHDDAEKVAKLASLTVPWEYLLVRQHFLSFVVDASRQVFYLGHILEVGIRQGLLEGWSG